VGGGTAKLSGREGGACGSKSKLVYREHREEGSGTAELASDSGRQVNQLFLDLITSLDSSSCMTPVWARTTQDPGAAQGSRGIWHRRGAPRPHCIGFPPVHPECQLSPFPVHNPYLSVVMALLLASANAYDPEISFRSRGSAQSTPRSTRVPFCEPSLTLSRGGF